MHKPVGDAYEKITHALLYLAASSPKSRLEKIKAIKLLYLADRYHLRRYGRPITKDAYVAMTYGPVGTLAKDILEAQPIYVGEEPIEYARAHIDTKGYDYIPKREPNIQLFSESEKEALDFALENFGKYKWNELIDLTHAFPEWTVHQSELKKSGGMVPMNWLMFFDNPDPNNKDFKRFFSSGDVFEAITNPVAKESFIDRERDATLWK